ncbi:MAG: hypothetical protein RL272_889 [Candidatus Parcubacteria bacterium]|jgi:hypothetical protein
MRFASCLLCCCLLPGCAEKYEIKAAVPEKALPNKAALAVVRIDVGGSIAGSGVVVTPQGHIVTASTTFPRYRTGEITVGEDRIKASVVAIDGRHQLALLKSERPLAVWAKFGPAGGPARDVSARIVGYAVVQSEPPMAERRNCSSRIEDPHYRGDSADDLDLHDLLVTETMNDVEGLKIGGSAVFVLDDGRLAGVVIGRMRTFGPSPLLAIPSATVRSFLGSRQIAVPSED